MLNRRTKRNLYKTTVYEENEIKAEPKEISKLHAIVSKKKTQNTKQVDFIMPRRRSEERSLWIVAFKLVNWLPDPIRAPNHRLKGV